MGMIKQLKAISTSLVAAANLVACAGMAVSAYSDRLTPSAHPYLSVSGLAFPIMLAVNVAFLVFWVVFKKRMAIIPLLGFVAVYPQLRLYMPLNASKEIPVGSLKILSYNVQGFRDKYGEKSYDAVFDYVAGSKADIVCLQEAQLPGYIDTGRLDSAYAYHDTVQVRTPQGNTLAIYSRFPLLRKERINYESEGNGSVGFYLKVGYDTVLVVCNHLESSHLSPDERQRYKDMLKGEMGQDTARAESKRLLHKLAEQTKHRSVQADAVAAYIASRSRYPLIVCGDFNDSPISYAHRTIAKGLTDCYEETGWGLGWSYNQKGFFVRIDHILCSRHFVPYGCKVDATTTASDHYPIYCWLKKRQID